MTDFKNAFFDYDTTNEKSQEILSGEIGVTVDGQQRTTVPNRPQFVYVRLFSNLSEVVQAYNDRVFPGWGLPVLVRWNKSRYEVIGRDGRRYSDWKQENPLLPKHGDTHSMDKDGSRFGNDPVWVYPYQIMPALVSPFNIAGIRNAYVHPYLLNYQGDWKYLGNTGTPDLVQYNPTSGSSLVLITLDANSGDRKSVV